MLTLAVGFPVAESVPANTTLCGDAATSALAWGAASAHTTTRKRKVRPGTRPPICRLIYVETSITSAAQGTIGRPPAPEELDMTVRSLRALAASCVLVLSAP